MGVMSEELRREVGRSGYRENLGKADADRIWKLITRDEVSGLKRICDGRYYIFCPAIRAEGHYTTTVHKSTTFA